MENITKKIGKKAVEKLSYFNRIDSVQKLSTFYASRTTKYAGVLDTNLFIIKTDRESIVTAGYSANCKAIVIPNAGNALIVEYFAAKNQAETAKKECEKQDEINFSEKKRLSLIFISENPEKIAELRGKMMEKFGRECSKSLQWLAYRIWCFAIDSKNTELTKTSIFHVL